ncbi:MAG: hypothetical protein FWF22_00100 [Treponema sp.]|nr:hypothetical protein [Treponema sp.]
MEKNRLQNSKPQNGCRIIPFPCAIIKETYNNSGFSSKKIPDKIISGRLEDKLPESIPDFRPYLQRNGLILLSWDKRLYKSGSLYTAYWVTSSGIHRYYASPALHIEHFPHAMPHRKSYAAEDGIDFYGEPGPLYIVHVAPELMMSCSEKKIQRPEHIKKLKDMGIKVDFNYSFILTREKKRQFLESTKGA